MDNDELFQLIATGELPEHEQLVVVLGQKSTEAQHGLTKKPASRKYDPRVLRSHLPTLDWSPTRASSGIVSDAVTNRWWLAT
ncbi:hypothetical protein VN12_05340 [Pirellula sp. SH-Sr6A]|uniref:hypothetical protein n=1 Tax=Pirellula sp. SH-Sr6A TaxID=1632865 RepID=UPI00078EEF03|nr:hypothetical protein [Pirellula sp. SH-Sr6A]AMV31521.1 hypothetical protein VN12_05340 [Pirellula sp. SH-Sr6A]